MLSSHFVRSVFISLIGHLTVLSIFSFSFGNKPLNQNYAGIIFFGRILEHYDLTPDLLPHRDKVRHEKVRLQNRTDREERLISNDYLPAMAGSRLVLNNGREKPAVNLVFKAEKIVLATPPTPRLSLPRTKEPVIMFYPYLPYNFSLYFQDRQAVHIELIFNIISNGKTNYIVIKRKTSSGNLEADLLTKRYISHYLFIQQASFSVHKWQVVKIDLSKKE